MKCLLALLRALFAFHSHNFALQPTNTRVTVFPKHYEPPSTFLTSATQVSAVHARVLRHQSSSAPDLQRPRLESALAFNCSSPSVSTSRSLDGVAFRCRNGCRNKSDDVWKTPCQCLCQPASSFWYCGVRFSAVRMRGCSCEHHRGASTPPRRTSTRSHVQTSASTTPWAVV